MDEFILDVKKAAVEAVAAEKPVAIHFGTVITDAPLTLKINQKTLLKEDCLAFLNGVGSGSPLNIGDVVALARIQGGKRYLVLDRVGYPEYSSIDDSDAESESGTEGSGGSGGSSGGGSSGSGAGTRFTAREVEWLAALIYYESRGMPRECQELVAQVAVNRVKSKKSGFNKTNTLEQVLKAKNQYGYPDPRYTATKIFQNRWTTEHEAVQFPNLVTQCRAAAKKVAAGQSRDENGKAWPSNILYHHSLPNPNYCGIGLFRTYTQGSFFIHFNYG